MKHRKERPVRNIVTFVFALILCTSAGKMVHSAPEQEKPPNVVIIMADDMGFSDIGAYGATKVRTPNLDNLAENGLRYKHFYNAGKCSPTRASLLTGLYPHQAGVGNMTRDKGEPGYRGRLNEKSVTIAEALKPAGYFTAAAGKWHVTPFRYGSGKAPHRETWPLQRGFDRFEGTLAGGGNYFDPPGYVRGNERVEPGEDFYYTRAISDASVRFIREAEKANKPLFLYVAHFAPHWPLHALKEDIEKYKETFQSGWTKTRSARFEKLKQMGLAGDHWTLSDPPGNANPWSKAENRDWNARRMAVYAAIIDRLDQGVGRIVRALEETGRLENTLIMFLSDNGAAKKEPEGNWIMRYAADWQDTDTWGTRPDVMPGGPDTFQGYGIEWANVSNTPFRKFKKFTHEGGIATPLIVHWPAGIEASGEFRHQVGHVMDLMPTVLDAAGVEYPDSFDGRDVHPMQGRSLVPSFDRDRTTERTLFWEYNGHRAVRKGDWKLVSTDWPGNWELYNLARDRSETENLADDYPERVKRLSDMWQRWAKRTNVIPRPN